MTVKCDLPKSLHTITAIINVACALKAQVPGVPHDDAGAVAVAVKMLGLEGQPDVHGLIPQAVKLVGLEGQPDVHGLIPQAVKLLGLEGRPDVHGLIPQAVKLVGKRC